MANERSRFFYPVLDSLETFSVAARVSDVIAITMLFLAGHAYGKYAGHQAWDCGLSMVISGRLMVGLTIGLGG